jgi:hypothetical protein
MPTYPSRFEFVIVFAVIFAAGIATSIDLRRYTDKKSGGRRPVRDPRFYPHPHDPYDPGTTCTRPDVHPTEFA